MTWARQEFKLLTINKLTFHKKCKMSIFYSGNMRAVRVYNDVMACNINKVDVINGENVIYEEKDIYVEECHLSGGKNLSARHGRACPGHLV
jgi:hypothetical protein